MISVPTISMETTPSRASVMTICESLSRPSHRGAESTTPDRKGHVWSRDLNQHFVSMQSTPSHPSPFPIPIPHAPKLTSDQVREGSWCSTCTVHSLSRSNSRKSSNTLISISNPGMLVNVRSGRVYSLHGSNRNREMHFSWCATRCCWLNND